MAKGWEMFAPAVAGRGQGEHKAALKAPARELIGLQPAGTPLLAFKQAEAGDGFVFRTCDFAGAGGKLKLTLPQPACEIFSCDLVETNPRKEAGHGKTITVPIKPFSPTTLKVRF